MGIGFGITFTVVSLGIAWQTRRRGTLILDAGVLEGPVLSRKPVDYLSLVVLFAGTWLWSKRVGPYPLVMMPLALVFVLAVVFVMKKKTHLRFTDQGICYVGLLKWAEIHSYRWEENPEGGKELVLEVSTKLPYVPSSYRISGIHHERVEEVLAAHVRGKAS